MTSDSAAELEELGIVWDTADAAFAENLAAARAYHQQHGTLAAPRHATALDRAVGQWLTNVRRPGGLGKDPVRAEERAAALAAIDENWNPSALGWTVDWQRHYTYLAQLLNDGTRLAAIIPGVTRHGEDVGRWLATQRRDFRRLNQEQQRRLAELGVKPARAVPARTAATTARSPRGARGEVGRLVTACPILADEGSSARTTDRQTHRHRTSDRNGGTPFAEEHRFFLRRTRSRGNRCGHRAYKGLSALTQHERSR